MVLEKPMRLHHVGYVTAEIAQAVSEYKVKFNYRTVSDVIHDPVQTAFVCFLQMDNDTSYLEFVAPDGPDSVLAAAAKRRPGLNHLCYTAGPLEATISFLEENGMRLISEPRPGVAFSGRRICWLIGDDLVPIELVERRDDVDRCAPASLAKFSLALSG